MFLSLKFDFAYANRAVAMKCHVTVSLVGFTLSMAYTVYVVDMGGDFGALFLMYKLFIFIDYLSRP